MALDVCLKILDTLPLIFYYLYQMRLLEVIESKNSREESITL